MMNTKEKQPSQYPIITVIGNDNVGIVAQLSAFLWDMNINIVEIQQGVMRGSFFMVMSVDISISNHSIPKLAQKLEELGAKIGVKIDIYDQEIFKVMNKI